MDSIKHEFSFLDTAKINPKMVAFPAKWLPEVRCMDKDGSWFGWIDRHTKHLSLFSPWEINLRMLMNSWIQRVTARHSDWGAPSLRSRLWWSKRLQLTRSDGISSWLVVYQSLSCLNTYYSRISTILLVSWSVDISGIYPFPGVERSSTYFKWFIQSASHVPKRLEQTTDPRGWSRITMQSLTELWLWSWRNLESGSASRRKPPWMMGQCAAKLRPLVKIAFLKCFSQGISIRNEARVQISPW